jgi:four helix bundle protein
MRQARRRCEKRGNDDAAFDLSRQYSAMVHRDLKVLDASEQAVERVDTLLDGPDRRRLLYADQRQRSVQSISANVAEAFGRGPGRDRARLLRIARGETEESLRHLGANFRGNRIRPGDYWPLRNRLVVMAKMLRSLITAED